MSGDIYNFLSRFSNTHTCSELFKTFTLFDPFNDFLTLQIIRTPPYIRHLRIQRKFWKNIMICFKFFTFNDKEINLFPFLSPTYMCTHPSLHRNIFLIIYFQYFFFTLSFLLTSMHRQMGVNCTHKQNYLLYQTHLQVKENANLIKQMTYFQQQIIKTRKYICHTMNT